MRNYWNKPEGGGGGVRGGRSSSGKRYFGRGGVKYALLELLADGPMHGYQMMKQLEEKSGGLYIPSAGSVYPALQMLEDRDLVRAEEAEGKKVYSMTEAGETFLKEREQHREGHHPHHKHRDGHYGKSRNMRKETAGLLRLVGHAERLADSSTPYSDRYFILIDKLTRDVQAFLQEAEPESGELQSDQSE